MVAGWVSTIPFNGSGRLPQSRAIEYNKVITSYCENLPLYGHNIVPGRAHSYMFHLSLLCSAIILRTDSELIFMIQPHFRNVIKLRCDPLTMALAITSQ